MTSDNLSPQWDLRNIEERAASEIMYSTQSVEDLAIESGVIQTLNIMTEILRLGSSLESLSLELSNGHQWKISRKLGLISADFICDGGEGEHSEACIPPGELGDGDLDFLIGR